VGAAVSPLDTNCDMLSASPHPIETILTWVKSEKILGDCLDFDLPEERH
jgi:hypothetical protein